MKTTARMIEELLGANDKSQGIRGMGQRLRERQAMPRVPRTLADYQRLAEGTGMTARIAKRVLARKTGGLA